MLGFPALHREDLKRKRNFVLAFVTGSFFYQLNIVKLLFNKNCQSWASQSGVPGDRADAGDKVIPGKLFSTYSDFIVVPSAKRLIALTPGGCWELETKNNLKKDFSPS